MTAGAFEWDKVKEQINLAKHGVDFTEAQQAFLDPLRLIAADSPHTQAEPRLFCIGQTERGILTVYLPRQRRHSPHRRGLLEERKEAL